MELTTAQIRYLLAVYQLQKNGAVRSADVAERLCVTRPSVHRMIMQLAQMQLLKKEQYASINFTENGLALAEKYDACFACVYSLLNKNLDLPSASAEEGALAVLGSLGLAKLEASIGKYNPCHAHSDAGRDKAKQ